ncbi:hypothetical protein ACXR0O_27315 [Verrucomicrobiota bacterium sgz303538]
MLQKVGQPRGFSFLGVIGTVATLLILAALLVPYPGGCGESSERVQARNDLTQLVVAIKAYNLEYGHLPLSGDRSFTDEASQARLLQVLQGDDDAENPRRIVFFEGKIARSVTRWWFGPRRYRAGFHPVSGALLDSWGHPYRIVLDSDYDGKIQSPYQDDEEIHNSVLAWSLGEDGVQGAPGKENILKDSGDIVSWH